MHKQTGYNRAGFRQTGFGQTVGGLATAAVLLGVASTAAAAPVVFEVGGSNAASIQATVDAFRAALGDPNNANAPGPIVGGRREINWDGGGGNFTTSPPVTPFDVFLDSRGARFTTPGSGLTQAPPTADLVQDPSGGGGLAGLFGNPTYATTFGTFSPERLFVPVDSNVTDGFFFIPGTAGGTPATVSGFGAVFADVDLADVTQIQFFDSTNSLLYQDFVPVATIADAGLSFLGVVFDAGELVSRIRITTGNTALGPNDDPSGGTDVVAMDDFLYGEPIAAAQGVPEPASLALVAGGLGLILLVGGVRRRSPTDRAG